MKYSKKILIFFFIIILSSCLNNSSNIIKGDYYYQGIYFGKNITPIQKQGIEEGCKTAKGNYTKSHTLFNQNESYNEAWFIGRNKCN